MFRRIFCTACLFVATTCSLALGQSPPGTPADDGVWENGIPDDPNFFPLAVWLQNPRHAERYARAGINLYVGLWKGPTEAQLSALKAAGMRVICAQNEIGLQSENADVIVGWMHGDEPDNAQPKKSGGGYGPPIDPSVIKKNYQRIRSRDPTRPVLLNLGQGVAFDDYIGRGIRRNHPEDYREYIRGSDIVSFDIYPAVHDNPQVAGKLEFVARGVERLGRWSNHEKIVWNCIECSRISNPKVKPTPEQIRSEVWMSLIHGSRGIIYFVHQFEPTFQEASLLEDQELLRAVTAINRQITEFAAVLNSPTIQDAVVMEGSSGDVPIAVMCKRQAGSLYVFAVNLRPTKTTATLRLLTSDSPRAEEARAAEVLAAEVLDENRTLQIRDQRLVDEFDGYGVHIYRIATE